MINIVALVGVGLLLGLIIGFCAAIHLEDRNDRL